MLQVNDTDFNILLSFYPDLIIISSTINCLKSEPNRMTNQNDADGHLGGEEIIRPIGAWVVGGFLLFVSLAIWFLVAVIFMHRA